MNNIVPYEDRGDSDEPGSPQQDREQRRKRSRRRRPIFSREDCLVMLTQIPGMIKAGFVAPTEANAIRAVLHTILDEHRQSKAGPGSQKQVTPKMLDLIREHAELQDWFEPLLTDPEFDSLHMHDDE